MRTCYPRSSQSALNEYPVVLKPKKEPVGGSKRRARAARGVKVRGRRLSTPQVSALGTVSNMAQDPSSALSPDTQTAINEYPVVPEPTPKALALPAATSEPARVTGALVVVEGLSFSEVIARYEIGASTLRKWLAAGKLTGAARVATSKGLAYRIPEAALIERGVLLKSNAASSVELAQVKAQASTLATKLKEVESLLTVERARAEREKARADSEAKQRALLEEGQADLRRALLMLEAATVKKRLRWWRK